MASVSTRYTEVPTPRSVRSQESDDASQDELTGQFAGLSVPGLESMQNSRLLDIVDRVRQIDIERKIELPEIVVCGDQSSGKSSVLEGVTGIPFPRAEGTCTKFATEIQLRRSDRSFGQVTIRPDPHRANKAVLQNFRETVTDFRQLPAIMERASALILRNERGPQTFSQDVLEVHVEGPKKHPFTIIDLPGLVRNERLAGDRAVVENIVDSYVSRSRSIILAVLAANYDADNQGILSTAQRVDPDGSRTLGIITKPDRVETSSAGLSNCLRMAMNQDPKYHFQLGWHVVKNRTADETSRQTSADERDRNEVLFFEDPRKGWASLPSQYWGVQTLRNRLTTLLESHTRRHLPVVLQEVMSKLEANQTELDTLTGYDTPEQLRDRFLALCYDMTSVAEKGLSGKANDAFYGLDDKDRWIRASIVQLNEAFDKDLRANGHNGRFEWDGDTIATGMNTFQNFVFEFLGWSRGHEMPGNIDPQRKDTVFWHLSKDWNNIARTHAMNAHEAVKQFLNMVVQTYIGEEFPHAVGRVQSALAAELNRRQKSAGDELKKLEEDRRRPVKTQNKSYLRQREDQLALLAFRDANRINRAADRLPSGLTANRIAELTGTNDIQKSRFNTAEQFCLEILIHYKIARDVFVDNVEMQVIERHLMDRLHYIFNVLANKPIDEVAAMLKDDNQDERMRKKQAALNRRKMLEAVRDELRSA